MLRVLIELLPFGDPTTKRTLGVMEIANVGTSEDGRIGNYRYVLSDESGPASVKKLRAVGKVEGHDRLTPVSTLILKCLQDATRE